MPENLALNGFGLLCYVGCSDRKKIHLCLRHARTPAFLLKTRIKLSSIMFL